MTGERMADTTTARLALTPATFDRFQDAYLAVLGHVAEHYEFVNAPRGNQSRETLNVSFRLVDPRDRLAFLPARKVNVVFNWAEALFYIWARNDLDMIAYYAPRIRAYSSDGETLTGSAYGRRLFQPLDSDTPPPWAMFEDLLREDPESKRAVATFFRPEELAIEDNLDVACIIALQFLQREGKLHAVAYMRANDAVQGLLSDVFSFSLIQELLARQLGLELGTYAHHVGSMHIGDRDHPRVQRVLADSDNAAVHFPVATMPSADLWESLRVVEAWERTLRLNEARLAPADKLGLDPYWVQVLLLFEAYRQIAHEPDRQVSADTLDALNPANRWLLAHRWPERMPDSHTPEGSRPP